MATNPTVSEEGPESFFVGAGVLSCGKILATSKYNQLTRTIYFTWVQGFLSGLNVKYLRADTPESATDLSDNNALQIWIENYCQENPLDQYHIAATALWHVLRARQRLDPDFLALNE